MTMNKTEKGLIKGMVFCLIIFMASSYVLMTSIEKLGGVKGLIVEAGKEIKDIANEIDKHQPLEQESD